MPEDWTPEQALSVYECLIQVAKAVWEHYEVELLPLLSPDPSAEDATQPDLFDPDDKLPF